MRLVFSKISVDLCFAIEMLAALVEILENFLLYGGYSIDSHYSDSLKYGHDIPAIWLSTDC